MLFIFSTTVLIRYLWQLKTVVFLHWCLKCTVLLKKHAAFVFLIKRFFFFVTDAKLIFRTAILKTV